MSQPTNSFGQPIGFAVPDWRPATRPGSETLVGEACRIERLDPDRHAADLYEANSDDYEGRLWTYLAYGPFESFESYRAWAEGMAQSTDPLFYAILDSQTGKAVGVASYLRIDPANGVIEVGHINFSPRLQRSRIATEAMYLMMRHVFELGYRRYEWKCDALNAKSRAAAERFGFTYEGTFRQATIYKGRNRDTAWFALIDRDWPKVRAAFERWLDPANFDEAGQQRARLADLMRDGG